jgi:hypothetical protein
MSFFLSFTNIGEQEGRTGPAWGREGLVPVREKRWEGEYDTNTVYTCI